MVKVPVGLSVLSISRFLRDAWGPRRLLQDTGVALERHDVAVGGRERNRKLAHHSGANANSATTTLPGESGPTAQSGHGKPKSSTSRRSASSFVANGVRSTSPSRATQDKPRAPAMATSSVAANACSKNTVS